VAIRGACVYVYVRLYVTQAVESPRHRMMMTDHADEARMDDDRETEVAK